MSILAKSLLRTLDPPAIQGRWYCFIEAPNGENYRAFVENFSGAGFSVAANPRVYAAKEFYYPGHVVYPPISLSLYENHKMETSAYIERWRSKIVTEDGVYGKPSDYRRNIVVEYYGLEDTNKPIRTEKWRDCWINDRGPLELNYSESDGRLILTMELSNHGYELI